MIHNELGCVAESNLRRWTVSARDCYLIGGQCEICPYYELMKNQPRGCQMKATVLELVKVHGKPKEEFEDVEENSDPCANEGFGTHGKSEEQ